MIFALFALAFAKECAVLIDAGSSGSRFWVYSWTADSNTWQNDVPSDLNAEESYKVTPGIIEWFDDPAAMQAEFKKGLEEVAAYTKDEEVQCQSDSDIGMWLMSTAGLRTESNEEVNKILVAIAEWFKANAPFDWQYGRLLSGEEEAAYAWIGNNYVLGLLGEGDKVGIVEMGGQSLQIAFVPSNGIIMDNSYDLELFGSRYRIYAKSWNGFGIEATWENTKEMVSTDEGTQFLNWNGATYSHPCLPGGWSDDLSDDVDWEFEGRYDNVSCDRLVEWYYMHYSVSDVCDYDVCSLAGAYVSDMEKIDFYGLSGIYHTFDALNRLNDSLGFSPSFSSLSQAIEAECELNVTELAEQMEGYNSKYDSWGCFKSKLVYQLLTMLPGFGDSATVTYGSAENANGMEGTWLVGALIEIMHSAAVEAAIDGTITLETILETNGTILLDTLLEKNETILIERFVDTIVGITGNDNKFLPYFLMFLVAFVIAAISFCYVFTSRSKVNAYAAPPQQETPEQQA